MNFRRTAPQIILIAMLAGGCKASSADTARQNEAPAAQLSEAGLRQVPLTITSKDKTHRFTIEIAETGEQQARGMMFRTELAPDAGMIFPFDGERIASFWMKNTVIPLDIIFIRRNGTIESIAANATPYSLDSVSSGEPVASVLELAGGRASELGIAPGDTVAWEN